MYENLAGRLKNLAKIKLDDNGMGNIPLSAEGFKAIKEIAEEAANAIEALEALLQGCSAAVQKPEVENSEVDEDGVLCEVSVPVLGWCADGKYRLVHRIDETTMEPGGHEWHGWTTLYEERVVDVQFWWSLPMPPKEEA